MTHIDQLDELFDSLTLSGPKVLTKVLLEEVERVRLVIDQIAGTDDPADLVFKGDQIVLLIKTYLCGEISYVDRKKRKDIIRGEMHLDQPGHHPRAAYRSYHYACADLPLRDDELIEAHMTIGDLINFYRTWTTKGSKEQARKLVLANLKAAVKKRTPLTKLAPESRDRVSTLAH
jgi:hypothetical protein